MDRPTHTLLGEKAREAVWKGVNAIYNPVKITLGPYAKRALLYRTMNRGSRIVDDGYQVAEVQVPKDIHVRIAADTFKESCRKTNQKVGDLTTTTAIIGGRLFNDGYGLLSDGASELTAKRLGTIDAVELRQHILRSAHIVKEEIKRRAKKVETLEALEHIAFISVNDFELGKNIAKMAWEVGADGCIDVMEGYKGEIEYDVVSGMRFHAKPAHKAFLTNKDRFEMVAENAAVIV